MQLVLGNDVVDLRQAKLESNWQREGYLAKVCDPEEQHLVLGAADPFLIFWLLWTMKEAAYKVVNRLTGERNYSPASFSCQQLDLSLERATAEVGHNQFKLQVRAVITEHFIHSIAVLAAADFQDLIIYQDQYHKQYLERFNAQSADHQLIKNSVGLPFMLEQKKNKIYPATVSHHGRYLFIVYSGSLELIN